MNLGEVFMGVPCTIFGATFCKISQQLKIIHHAFLTFPAPRDLEHKGCWRGGDEQVCIRKTVKVILISSQPCLIERWELDSAGGIPLDILVL